MEFIASKTVKYTIMTDIKMKILSKSLKKALSRKKNL